MILEYRCKNFMSFKDEIEFSMIPKRVTKRYEENVYMSQKHYKYLKSAVIFGENAGGKTNFIKSLDFLQRMFKGTLEAKSMKGLTHCNNEENQEFFISVLIDDVIYNYNVEIDEFGIVNESLSIKNSLYSKEKELLKVHRCDTKDGNFSIYEDSETGINFKLSEGYYLYKNLNISNERYIAKNRYVLGLFPDIDKNRNEYFSNLKNYITKKIKIETNDIGNKDWLNKEMANEYSVDVIKTNEYFKIFKIIDGSICKIEVDEKRPFEDTKIIREDIDGNKFFILLKDDSTGTQDFFKWSISLYDVIYNNCIVFADEVDRVLNTIISNKIVRLVNGSNHKGQFIFSTHNIMNLNIREFMKEQIYFVSKEPGTIESELYTLADFEDIRNTDNIEKLYLKGVFGGVPNS